MTVLQNIINWIFRWSNRLFRPYPLCHSLPQRSFCYHGRYFGLCARCSAMYFSGFLMILLFPVRQGLISPVISFLIGIIFIIPTAIDGITQFRGLRESTNTLRVITGILLGIGAVLVPESIIFYTIENLY